MLAHQLDRLSAAGVTRVCIVVGYRGQMIKDYFQAHPPSGVEVEYVLQSQPNGTAPRPLLPGSSWQAARSC